MVESASMGVFSVAGMVLESFLGMTTDVGSPLKLVFSELFCILMDKYATSLHEHII